MQCLEYPFDCAMILAKKRALRRELLAREGLVEKRVAILSGSTVGDIKNILELFLLNAGIRPVFYVGDHARFYEEGLYDPSGALAAFAPDVIYMHTSIHNLNGLPSCADSPEEAGRKFKAETQRWLTLWRAMQRFGCPVIQNNFELPDVRALGNLDAVDARGRVRFVSRMNDMTALWAEKAPDFYLHDLCWLSASVGLDRWCSPTAWTGYQYAQAVECIPLLCHSVAGIIKSVFGKNKKGLVLDLDNTLWGGVIGDEGAEGVALGEESPAGRAFTEFQRYIKELSHRGVLLNVASKNEEAAARSGFERADSVLRAEDFLCFEANWEPKPHSVAAIAKTLNILPESLVFVDDNPAERELMRRELPEVSAPELTQPDMYTRILDRGGWFEPVNISADDTRRADMYRENKRRADAEAQFTDYAAYLRSLDMRCALGAFDDAHLARITQLINKTNQFNLTTRRYTEGETAACADDENRLTLYARLADKFGDNGIVSALIGRWEPDALEIELWVMSCRVFKRGLEYAVFDAVCDACRARGVHTIIGKYIPTAKNAPVAALYPSLGFERADDPGGENEQETAYRFAVPDEAEPKNTVMEVVSL